MDMGELYPMGGEMAMGSEMDIGGEMGAEMFSEDKCGDKVWGYKFDHDGFWGGYIHHNTTDSDEECGEKCSYDPECVAFDRLHATGDCYFYKETGDVVETTGEHAFVECEMPPEMEEMEECGDEVWGYKFHHDGFWGGYIHHNTTYSDEECGDLCYEDPECVAFDRVHDTGDCYFYKETGDVVETTGEHAFVQCEMPVWDDCGKEVWGYKFDHDGYWGGYIHHNKTDSDQECGDLCLIDPECVAFDRVHGTGDCYFYKQTGDVVATDGEKAYNKCEMDIGGEIGGYDNFPEEISGGEMGGGAGMAGDVCNAWYDASMCTMMG